MSHYSSPAPNFGNVPHSWALPTSELIISLNIGSSQGNRSGRGLTGLRYKDLVLCSSLNLIISSDSKITEPSAMFVKKGNLIESIFCFDFK